MSQFLKDQYRDIEKYKVAIVKELYQDVSLFNLLLGSFPEGIRRNCVEKILGV